MRNLLDFLAKYNYWFVFILLETAGMTLLFRYNSYQSSVWFSSANMVVGRVYEVSSWVETFLNMSQANEILTHRNIVLEQRNRAMEERLAALGGDEAEGEVARMNNEGYDMIAAKVVSNSVSRTDNLITIDKGSADGVEKDMGVVCGNGVVGTVYLTSAHYSVVIPVLNHMSNISVMVKGRGYYGYLHWTGGDPMKASVDDVPRHARFSIGDLIVTSGYSAIFPPGVLAGRVKHVFNSADGLSYRIEATLSTDFSCLRDVYVITDSRIKEQAAIMRAATDSIQSSNK